MWLRRIFGLLSGAAILLASRWSMRIARPADDVRAARRVWWHIEEKIAHYRFRLRNAFGPVTPDMHSAWERLRERYRDGTYGVEGT